MTPIESYLAELRGTLHVRGRDRRRLLSECREHLRDAAAELGEEAAVRRFGSAAALASSFDTEIAASRGIRATIFTVAGVLGTGGSALALIGAADRGASAPTVWAVIFFLAAQLAGAAAGLAMLQALAQRRSPMSPADVLLLARRNGCALLAAGVALFAAGAALPGRGSAVLLLAGPVLVLIAVVAVGRSRSLARRLDGARLRGCRPPLADLSQLTHLRLPVISPARLLAATAGVAAVAAFIRDHGEQASVGQAVVTGAIEAAMVVGCFVVLGRPLGLWRPTR